MTEQLTDTETVRVDLGPRSYDILIGRGLLEQAGARLAALLPGSRAAIITDENLAKTHLEALQASFDEAGVSHVTFKVPAGESTKRFSMFERLCDDVLGAKLERGDAIVALGGGVVGDLAGFVAASVRRGMNFIQVPTSLLAQVDSSVGGKTGINSRHGKNLIGAFHQPRLVLADTALLDTLSPREFRAGYAEVAKYGLIDDADFFAWLEENHAGIFSGGPERERAVATSCRAKARIVAEDEFEAGARALLNLGHTFGHALEAAVDYNGERLVHGEGVAIGMRLAHDFSVSLGLCAEDDARRVEAHLKKVGLPTHMSDIPGQLPPAETLLDIIAQDKKVTKGTLTFILKRGIGRSFVERGVERERVLAFLERELA
ncbi:3-dehydroquinate synthase [Rhizobiales bacterium]|uniref:3-dehydroquinate synthase n=1 Tax=Hongsoonwoonella zoysiae TaxID=2821844 RepID=UPI00155FEF7D|nr:3-dehydroquinate synthase [Hongsoonwoonella zoysiae]NRG17042.1 3-dehydroquinate synthase [Hongsoonwoonella zoysiae]